MQLRYACLLFFVLYNFVVFGQHVLIPEPQVITYRNGNLSLDKIIVKLNQPASKADANAIKEMVQIFKNVGFVDIQLFSENCSCTPNILINRTQQDRPLPGISELDGKKSREYYTLEVNPRGIKLQANSSAAIFYAAQTLKQLLKVKDGKIIIPFLSLEDWPSMPYRGFMMDMTHMQLPTIKEIKNQLDFLSQWKVNQYYFYSEVNIELKGYPLLAPEARFSKKEMREIIDYAASKFIDVVPNVNLYGHLHDLFKFEHYANLAITPYGREFNSSNKRRDTIVNDWIKQFADIFDSPFLNIGFDETWLINLEAKKLNKPAKDIFLEMLNKTLLEVQRNGKKPIIYADMLQKYESIIGDITVDYVPVPWHYTPVDTVRYSKYFSPFKKRKMPFFVQSATLNYFYLYPAYSLSLENHRRLFREGLKSGANGFIMSGWTDDTQALMRSSKPDMAFGGAISWNYSNTSDTVFFQEYSAVACSPRIQSYWLEAQLSLVEAEQLTREVFGMTNEAIWKNPFSEQVQSKYLDKRDKLQRARYLVESAQIQLREALKLGEDTITLQAMFAASKELELLTTRYLFAGRVIDVHRSYRNKRDNKEFRGVMAEVVGLISSLTNDMHDCVVETESAFIKAWLNEYTDYRIGIAKAKFNRELIFWLRTKDHLKSLLDVKDSEELPSLEKLLDFY